MSEDKGVKGTVKFGFGVGLFVLLFAALQPQLALFQQGKQITENKEALETQEVKLNEHTDQLTRLEETTKKHGERLDAHETRLDGQEQALESLDRELASHAEKLGQLDRELAASKNSAQEDRAKVEALETRRVELLDELRQLKEQVKTLQSQQAASNLRLEQFESDILKRLEVLENWKGDPNDPGQ